jgi:hypothetical protein
MNNGVKVLLVIVAALIGFTAINRVIHQYRDRAIASAADAKFAQLKANAAKNSPGTPEAVAVEKEASAEIGNLMSSTTDEAKRRQNAVGVFYGFYFVNVRSRVDYCNEQGVSIQPFIDLFTQNHAKVRDMAKPILEKNGENEEKLYAAIKTQLRGMTDTDMAYIASSNKTDAKGACQIIATRAETIADKMQLSKMQPAVYRALMTPP